MEPNQGSGSGQSDHGILLCHDKLRGRHMNGSGLEQIQKHHTTLYFKFNGIGKMKIKDWKSHIKQILIFKCRSGYTNIK